MGQIQRNLDTYCGIYDFATSGGAVGAYNLQVTIPENAIILEFGCIPTVPLASGTSTATISFDGINVNVNPFVTSFGLFLPTTIITALNTPPFAIMGISATGASGYTPRGASSTAIGMSIGVEALLGGQIVFWARCINFELIIP